MSITLKRAPRTRDELYWLIQRLWGITIPRTKVCPEHDAPFEAFATAYFSEEPQILIHGSRGLSGKSRLQSILGLTKAAVVGSDVNILGGSLAQSQNIHDTMRFAWESEHAPRNLKTKTDGANLVRLTNGAMIRPLTASQKTVRGPHPATLLLDEIDEMDVEILNAALGQPMPQFNKATGVNVKPVTAMSSTWQYADGTFTEIIQRFREEELPIFTWCYRESMNPVDGWLDPDFVEQKKREIPAEMWRVEYELGEPSIGNRAFDPDSIERMFADTDILESQIKKTREYEEYCFENFGTAEDYVISADWAKEQDWTVISVWNCSVMPAKLAYYVRMRRLPYPVMVDRYNKLMQQYRAEGIHDATGLGGVVADYIDDRAFGFKMVGEKRANMLSNFVAAVEHDKVRAPQVVSAYLAHKYCSVEDMYRSGVEFHLPDEVCSFALAWHLIRKRPHAEDPLIVGKDPGNYIEDGIRENKRNYERWTVGEVTRVSEEPDQAYELLV